MTNVNLFWNWFGTQVFSMYSHLKLYKNANVVNFVHYGKTRLLSGVWVQQYTENRKELFTILNYVIFCLLWANLMQIQWDSSIQNTDNADYLLPHRNIKTQIHITAKVNINVNGLDPELSQKKTRWHVIVM